MHADDIPTEVTKLVYTCPLSISTAVSQNQVAELLAHYWPAIEAHVLRQAASDIEQMWLPAATKLRRKADKLAPQV